MVDVSDFEAAAVKAKSLSSQPNDVLLELYSLYKQATEGDVSGDRPGMFDFVAGAKYDAWETRRGMPKEEAMEGYIALVEKLASA